MIMMRVGVRVRVGMKMMERVGRAESDGVGLGMGAGWGRKMMSPSLSSSSRATSSFSASASASAAASAGQSMLEDLIRQRKDRVEEDGRKASSRRLLALEERKRIISMIKVEKRKRKAVVSVKGKNDEEEDDDDDDNDDDNNNHGDDDGDDDLDSKRFEEEIDSALNSDMEDALTPPRIGLQAALEKTKPILVSEQLSQTTTSSKRRASVMLLRRDLDKSKELVDLVDEIQGKTAKGVAASSSALLAQINLRGKQPTSQIAGDVMNRFAKAIINYPDRARELYAAIVDITGHRPNEEVMHALAMTSPSSAVEVISTMRQLQLVPNKSTYGVAVKYVCKTLGDLPQGWSLMTEMADLHPPMKVYIDERHRQDAVAIASLPATTTFLSACTEMGEYGVAWECYWKFIRAGGVADAAFYNTMLRLCSKEDKLERGLNFLVDMTMKGIRPDLYTFNHLMLAACRRKDVAFRYCTEIAGFLDESGIEWDSGTYHAMLQACRVSKKFDELVLLKQRMDVSGTDRKMRFTEKTYGILLGAAADQMAETSISKTEAMKKFKDLALSWWAELSERHRIEPTPILFTEYIRIFLEAREYQEVDRLLADEMYHEKFVKTSPRLWESIMRHFHHKLVADRVISTFSKALSLDIQPTINMHCYLLDTAYKANEKKLMQEVYERMEATGVLNQMDLDRRQYWQTRLQRLETPLYIRQRRKRRMKEATHDMKMKELDRQVQIEKTGSFPREKNKKYENRPSKPKHFEMKRLAERIRKERKQSKGNPVAEEDSALTSSNPSVTPRINHAYKRID